MKSSSQKIAFLGLGYVGLCTAATFASRGFEVVGIDVDAQRVDRIRSGEVPFPRARPQPAAKERG